MGGWFAAAAALLVKEASVMLFKPFYRDPRAGHGAAILPEGRAGEVERRMRAGTTLLDVRRRVITS